MKMLIKTIALSVLAFSVAALNCSSVSAQEYVSPTKAVQTGRSPGVKSKLTGNNGQSKTYILVFAPGDEVMSGLTEFAQTNQIQSAHFTAIGDATSAKIGWYDKSRKMFKVTSLNQPHEITSLIGDIAVYDGKPAVHAHINLASEDGMVHGGHLLEAFIAPTLEVILTVDAEPMYKKLNTEFGVSMIDPEMK